MFTMLKMRILLVCVSVCLTAVRATRKESECAQGYDEHRYRDVISCYKVYEGQKSYTEAENSCQKAGKDYHLFYAATRIEMLVFQRRMFPAMKSKIRENLLLGAKCARKTCRLVNGESVHERAFRPKEKAGTEKYQCLLMMEKTVQRAKCSDGGKGYICRGPKQTKTLPKYVTPHCQAEKPGNYMICTCPKTYGYIYEYQVKSTHSALRGRCEKITDKYHFGPKLNRAESQQYCKERGAKLAEPQSAGELRKLLDLAKKKKPSAWGYWLGWSNPSNRKVVNSHGEEVDFAEQFWGGEEPNDAGGNVEDQISIFGPTFQQPRLRMKLNDIQSDMYRMTVICQFDG